MSKISELRHKDHTLILDHPLEYRVRPHKDGHYGYIENQYSWWTNENSAEDVIGRGVCTAIGPCKIEPFEDYFSEWKLGLVAVYDDE